MYVLRIDSQCVATTPPNRDRTTIGVGEAVNLTACGVPPGDVTWTLSGGGKLSTTNQPTTTFTAPDTASTSVVTVHFNGGSCDKPFNVIQPGSLLFTNYPGFKTCFCPDAQHSGFWINYYADVYAQPDTVNFSAISLYESGAVSQCTGWYSNHCPPPHPPNGPKDMDSDVVSGKGTHMTGIDDIGMGASPEPFTTGGTVTWAIARYYRIGTGGSNYISTVNQVCTLHVGTDDTTFRVEKGASGYH